MMATAIVVFREVLEAALIIGIVAAATRGVIGRKRWISGGMAAGIAGAVIVALFADQISEAAQGLGQEIFNAGVLFAATVLLSWHNVWMAQHGRQLAARAGGLGKSVAEGSEPLYALAVVVAVAILREGSEVVLFLYGMAASTGGAVAMISGGAIGLVAGAALGVALYFGLLRIPMRHFFTATSWMILLLAAGMAALGARYLVQADILPALGNALWDSSSILSEQTLAGQILHTLVGYSARPMGIQVLFYIGTIAIVGSLMLLNGRRMARRSGAAVTALMTIALLAASGARPAHAGPPKVYSPIVEKGELEIETRGILEDQDAPANSNKLGSIFEIGYGISDRWFSSIFVETERAPGDKFVAQSIATENIIQLTEQGEHFVDVGLYLEYSAGLRGGEPDKFEGKILLEKTVGRIIHTANLIFEKKTSNGGGEGTEFEIAWQSVYRLRPEFEFGVQAFSKFGEFGNFAKPRTEEHLLGPAIFGRFRLGGKSFLAYEAGYLFGLTGGSPDRAFRWLLEIERYF